MEEIFRTVGLKSELSDTLLFATMLMARIIPIIFLTPFLGGKLVPAQTRMGLAIGLSVLCYPYAVAHVDGPLPTNGIVLLVLMFKELFIGYCIGFIASELFYAMEIGGRALDTMRGSNMAEVQVPELQMRASPVGQMNFQLLLVTFCAINGHGFFIEGVMESFRIVPVDGWPSMSLGMAHFIDSILKYTAALFPIAFSLVFPGIFSSFLVDVVFGMFNRIAPQLNAYFMAMGIKSMAGLAMFMFAMTLMTGQMAHHLENSLLFLRKVIAFMG